MAVNRGSPPRTRSAQSLATVGPPKVDSSSSDDDDVAHRGVASLRWPSPTEVHGDANPTAAARGVGLLPGVRDSTGHDATRAPLLAKNTNTKTAHEGIESGPLDDPEGGSGGTSTRSSSRASRTSRTTSSTAAHQRPRGGSMSTSSSKRRRGGARGSGARVLVRDRPRRAADLRESRQFFDAFDVVAPAASSSSSSWKTQQQQQDPHRHHHHHDDHRRGEVVDTPPNAAVPGKVIQLFATDRTSSDYLSYVLAEQHDVMSPAAAGALAKPRGRASASWGGGLFGCCGPRAADGERGFALGHVIVGSVAGDPWA